jgi:hypothetical protein
MPDERPSEGERPSASAIPTAIRTYEFTQEQLDKFLAEKWNDFACEICGTRSWTYDPNLKFVSLSSVDGKDNGVPSKFITVAFRTHCSNCGNTKFLAALLIKDWLEAHP